MRCFVIFSICAILLLYFIFGWNEVHQKDVQGHSLEQKNPHPFVPRSKASGTRVAWWTFGRSCKSSFQSVPKVQTRKNQSSTRGWKVDGAAIEGWPSAPSWSRTSVHRFWTCRIQRKCKRHAEDPENIEYGSLTWKFGPARAEYWCQTFFHGAPIPYAHWPKLRPCGQWSRPESCSQCVRVPFRPQRGMRWRVRPVWAPRNWCFTSCSDSYGCRTPHWWIAWRRSHNPWFRPRWHLYPSCRRDKSRDARLKCRKLLPWALPCLGSWWQPIARSGRCLWLVRRCARWSHCAFRWRCCSHLWTARCLLCMDWWLCLRIILTLPGISFSVVVSRLVICSVRATGGGVVFIGMALNGLMVARFVVSLAQFNNTRLPISVAVAPCAANKDVLTKNGTQKLQ